MSITLSKGKQGTRYRVMEINGTSETNRYLNNIGLHVGDTITIISKLSSLKSSLTI